MKLLCVNILCCFIVILISQECFSETFGLSRIDSLEAVAKENIKNDTAHIITLCKLATEYLPFNVEKGMEYANKAYNMSKKIKFYRGISEANAAMGLYYWLTSDFVNSFKHYLPALDYYISVNDSLGISKIYNNLGMLYGLIDYSEKSLEYFYKALDYDNKKNKLRIIQIKTNIAGVYKMQSRNDMAIKYYNEALELLVMTPNPILEEQLVLNLAVTYSKNGNYNFAYNHFNRADSLVKIIKNPFAFYALKTEKSKFIIKYLNDTNSCKQLVKSINYNKNYGLRKSINELTNCITYFNSINSLNSVADCYQAIYIAYKGLGNRTKALEYLEKTISIDDSISTVNMASKLTILETEREILIQNKQIELNKLDAGFQKKVAITTCIIAFLILLALFAVIAMFVYKSKQSKLLIIKNEEILDSHSKLEILVSRLSEKQMEVEKANIQLNEANAAKDKFFSIISHDLRSPFTGIIGLSDLLYSEIDRFEINDIRTISSSIHSTAKNAFELLDSLLQWSRSQLGAVEFSPSKHNILKLIEKTKKNLKPLADNKNIKISIHRCDDISLNCDDEMISTVLRNLLSNSIKFTHSKGAIDINGSVINNYYQVTIADNGIGMDNQTLESLFKLSKNISSKGTNNEKGTGFGLLLCKEFIDRHNGKIWAESQFNEGTKFHFMIPLEN